MSYTAIKIINLALGRIGVKRVSAVDATDALELPSENSDQAIIAADVWEFIRDEVMEARSWKFATRRKALGKHNVAPKSGYDCSYVLPDDFIRLAETTEDDPTIYPDGYPYKIETDMIPPGLGSALDFNPVTAYTAALTCKIGPWVELDCGSSKDIYVCAPYQQDDATILKVAVATAGDDTLAVAGSGDTITISLAKTTSGKNTAALIQAAIRAVSTLDGVSLAAWTVTGNAAYDAAPPIAATIAATGLGSGNEVYECILAGTSKWPTNQTTYWQVSVPSAAKILVTDFDNETASDELVVRYVAKLEDPTMYSPSFVNALAFRLAAELAIHLTEGMTKFKSMMEMYYLSLGKASEVNQSLDYFETVDTWGNDKASNWADIPRSGSQSAS